MLKKFQVKYLGKNNQFLLKWLVIILGTISWSWTMVKSGWMYSFGMGFWGANGHDGIWHIALAENLSKWSFGMPVFSGYLLKNYHIGFDFFLALIHKITFIPIVNIYFQIIPPILAVAIGVLIYNFVFEWRKSASAALWSVFFTYFGGGFGYLIGKGESAFWSQESISTLINPPFALSLVVILSALIFLQKNKKVMAAILFGLLIEIKAYIGILALGSLFLIAIWKIIKEKKYDYLLLFIAALLISLILYLPLNSGSQSLLVWQPFWFLETMMGLSDRIGWEKFYSAMTTYKSGHVWIKGITAYSLAFLIFYVGNMGTRMVKELAVWKWVKNLKSLGYIEIFLMSVIAGGVVIPLFFLQKGTPWNTIQFFYYSLFFSGVLAGIAMSEIKNKIVIAFVILLTIPTTLVTLKDVYLPSRPPAEISNEELSALLFLSKEPSGVVLTYPFDQAVAKEAESNPPRPLYLYASTAYVSAFSAHPVFLEDQINLDIMGYDWPTRLSELQKWYKESDQQQARKFLKDNDIKYVYWLKGQRALLGEGQLGLKNVYENNLVTVYAVQ